MHSPNPVLDERHVLGVTQSANKLSPLGQLNDNFCPVSFIKCSKRGAALLAVVLVTSSGCAYFRPGPPPLSSESDEQTSKPVSWGFLDHLFYNQFTGP